MNDMISDRNLTRWNRAGLERFRYIDGNAVTYLEALRKNLAQSFPEWEKVQQGGELGETPAAKQNRLIAQYRDDRRDWAWEIARTFARSTHILTEHINAFANEGYLSTATQWEYMRRLVDMLDYRPRPPSSASAKIVLIANTETKPGLVKKGLQSKFASIESGISVVFETLADIEIDPNLNELRLNGFDFNPNAFEPLTPTYDGWVAPEKAKVNVGQYAVLIQGNDAQAVKLSLVAEQIVNITKVDLKPNLSDSYILGLAQLGVEPDQVYAPALNGAGTVRVSDASLFSPGQVVAWSKGSMSGFARIKKIDEASVKYSDVQPAGSDLSGDDVEFFETFQLTQKQKEANGAWLVDQNAVAGIKVIKANTDGAFIGNIEVPTLTDFKGQFDVVFAKRFPHYSAHDLYYYDPVKSNQLGQISKPRTMKTLRIDGGVGKCRTGDWFVAESEGGKSSAVRALTIEEKDDHFLVEFESISSTLTNIALLYGPFNYHVHPQGFDRDPTIADLSKIELSIKASELSDIFVQGKDVIFESESENGPEAVCAKINEVVRVDDHGDALMFPIVSFELPALMHKQFNQGEVLIRGNIADYGHGETQPVYILGSGDAAEIRQSFILAREDVTYSSDPRLEAGVRADFRLKVGDKIFEEVSSLADSEDVDAHYETQMTEDGFVRILFGDGRNGRRLPTGRNNISVIYRKGTGSAGNNVPPYSFEKLAKPHARVKSLRQPLPTSGGQQVEDVNQIRQNAPDHLRSLNRGVALSDFEHIARKTPGIWHAKALEVQGRDFRKSNVKLCIVPVDDAPLGSLGDELRARLANLSSPNMAFSVERFDPVLLKLNVIVRVNSAEYDPDEVEARVRAAVFEAYKLEQRHPGDPVYTSQLYEIIENVSGVSNSRVSLFPGHEGAIVGASGQAIRKSSKNSQDTILVVWPQACQVVYLGGSAQIGIQIEEAMT